MVTENTLPEEYAMGRAKAPKQLGIKLVCIIVLAAKLRVSLHCMHEEVNFSQYLRV